MFQTDGTADSRHSAAVGGLTLHRLCAEDIDAIYGIECACFTDAYGRETLERELYNRISYYVVACVDGSAVGYAGIWKIAGEAEVISIAVLPEFRRRGVASHMMAELLRECGACGIGTVRLEVRRSNDGARRLYEGFGFRRYGVRERYYEDGEDAVLMIREEDCGGENTGD